MSSDQRPTGEGLAIEKRREAGIGLGESNYTKGSCEQDAHTAVHSIVSRLFYEVEYFMGPAHRRRPDVRVYELKSGPQVAARSLAILPTQSVGSRGREF